jgi:hypothetical protein
MSQGISIGQTAVLEFGFFFGRPHGHSAGLMALVGSSVSRRYVFADGGEAVGLDPRGAGQASVSAWPAGRARRDQSRHLKAPVSDELSGVEAFPAMLVADPHGGAARAAVGAVLPAVQHDHAPL